ncbi:DUF4942 domain-containing protein [Luteimonas sp. MC1750]|uniref:DUF4942 domain-containing protein n=1 Tax=Luteimonas sp. MC1750 TaxID=2799326 RepID=UPI0018F0B45E|nr:DUF4942 domain-containing protein [Luteimonas sp. MC1750]MBJ6983998.1 DUF4942 domain-containing protein [Luteimonas sp. MC1750]QQO06810.1 DUF4942 domain-containing protein [Luteimonas sp. MC1750]
MSQLIRSISVASLVADRQRRIEAARSVQASADARAFVEFLTGNTMHSVSDQERLARYIQAEDRRWWGVFIQASGLWDLFPRSVREDWHKALGWGDYKYRPIEDCPEFTADAALATFETYVGQRSQLRASAILDLYRTLSWDHATNKPALFGRKLIYKHFADYKGFTSTYGNNALDDLLRTLYRLDGRPEPSGSWHRADNATGYFEVRQFKNGNAHILIERGDLVDLLNAELAVICPGALPAPGKGKR